MKRSASLVLAWPLLLAACGGGGSASGPVGPAFTPDTPDTPGLEGGGSANQGEPPGEQLGGGVANADDRAFARGLAQALEPAFFASGGSPTVGDAGASGLTFLPATGFDGRSAAFAGNGRQSLRVTLDSRMIELSVRLEDTTNAATTFIDPDGRAVVSSVPNPSTLAGLDYASFGVWALDPPDDGAQGAQVPFNSFVFGVLTPEGGVPTSGGATYSGFGPYSEIGPSGAALNSNSQAGFEASADFSAGLVRAAFRLVDENGAADRRLRADDMGIAGNTFAGSVYGVEGASGYSGRMDGAFFGPGASEMGGSFELGGPTRIRGSFVAARDG